MLTSLNRLLGMPVIWQDKRLGSVERAVTDDEGRKLAGLVVRRGIGAARWAAHEDVALLGPSCVVLRRKPVRMPDVQHRELRCVFLTSGECAGRVTDVLISAESLHLMALEICQSPLDGLAGRRSYAVRFQCGGAAEENGVIAAQLLSWAQVKQHLKEEDDG